MVNATDETQASKQQRLVKLLQKLLPLVDGVTDWVRLIFILGLTVVVWIGFWMFKVQHFSLLVSTSLLVIALLPVLIIGYFWWALEELKNLPNIAGEMLMDVKSELLDSARDIRASKVAKIGIWGATKGLWSIASMLGDVRELLGSYISMATLLNPFMLGLGVVALGLVFMLLLIGIMLAIMLI